MGHSALVTAPQGQFPSGSADPEQVDQREESTHSSCQQPGLTGHLVWHYPSLSRLFQALDFRPWPQLCREAAQGTLAPPPQLLAGSPWSPLDTHLFSGAPSGEVDSPGCPQQCPYRVSTEDLWGPGNLQQVRAYCLAEWLQWQPQLGLQQKLDSQ